MKKESKEKQQRTAQQNKALHKFFDLLSDELNTAGLDMKVIVKPSFSIWWTPESIKEYLWRPLQIAMFNKQSTTTLTTAQVNKIFEQLQHILGEKHGLELTFPSIENIIDYDKK